jgi:hypothetical protein
MTSFVHVAQPTEHPGVTRAGQATESIQHAAGDVFSPRGAASLLLAAIVSALLVVANQVVDTWSEGHLLLAWIVMWTIAFAALALAARPARAAVEALRIRMRGWRATRRAAAQDDIMWQLAMTDARMMADISRAMGHAASRNSQRAA